MYRCFKQQHRTSLVVRWLGLWAPSAGGPGSIRELDPTRCSEDLRVQLRCCSAKEINTKGKTHTELKNKWIEMVQRKIHLSSLYSGFKINPRLALSMIYFYQEWGFFQFSAKVSSDWNLGDVMMIHWCLERSQRSSFYRIIPQDH